MQEPLHPPPPPTREDLPAALARKRVPIYMVAARIRIHPIRLGRMLSGYTGLPPDVAVRLLAAIEDEAGSR
jgi:hypothetical protein